MGHFHVNEALAKAKELGQEPGYFCPAQFESEWNVEENRIWLGPEILAQLPEGVVPDAIVMGVGNRWDPHRRRTGFPGGEPCRQALRHGTLGVFDHTVRRGGRPPDRRYLRRLRSWHLRAPQGPGRHRPDRRLRGGRRGDAPPRQEIWPLRRPLQRRQPHRHQEGPRVLPRASRTSSLSSATRAKST